LNSPKYKISSSDKILTFEFISEGQRRLIHKLVKYQMTNILDNNNLDFGEDEMERRFEFR
jgi:hypothetical protein